MARGFVTGAIGFIAARSAGAGRRGTAARAAARPTSRLRDRSKSSIGYLADPAPSRAVAAPTRSCTSAPPPRRAHGAPSLTADVGGRGADRRLSRRGRRRVIVMAPTRPPPRPAVRRTKRIATLFAAPPRRHDPPSSLCTVPGARRVREAAGLCESADIPWSFPGPGTSVRLPRRQISVVSDLALPSSLKDLHVGGPGGVTSTLLDATARRSAGRAVASPPIWRVSLSRDSRARAPNPRSPCKTPRLTRRAPVTSRP